MRARAALALATLVVTACGASDGGGSGSSGFAGMLADVPAGAISEDSTLQYVDMAMAFERLGVSDADSDERLDALTHNVSVADGELGVTPRLFNQRITDLEALREEVGFDAVTVDREIAVDSPPSALRILDVAVDATQVEEAIESDPTWSDRLAAVDSDAGTYFDWTEDGDELRSDLTRVTAVRPHGVGGQLAVEGSGDGARVVRTHEAEVMEATLSLAGGDGESAADDGPFAGADEALEGDVLQLIGVADASSGAPPNLTPEQMRQFEAEFEFIDPYDALLVATTVVDDDARLEVVLLYPSPDDAQAAEPAVTALVTEGTTLSGTDAAELLPDATVEVDGSVVRVVSDEGSFLGLLGAVIRRDLFLTAF